jgi:hypothetical protein
VHIVETVSPIKPQALADKMKLTIPSDLKSLTQNDDQNG